MKEKTTIGVISDTHGLVRPEALEALAGVDLIVHAGDVGNQAVLDALANIAKVYAVRGNTDREPPCSLLSHHLDIEAQGKHIHILHNLEELSIDPVQAGCSAIIYGHTHKSNVSDSGGVLYLNPGSAGPYRFDWQMAIARLDIDGDGRLSARIINLPM
jgi:hypothetical protein